MAKIDFVSKNLTITVPDGSEFLEIKRKDPSVPLRFGCTRGDCGVCAIKIEAGKDNLTKLSPLEEKTLKKKGLDDSYRLACQCAVNGDLTIA